MTAPLADRTCKPVAKDEAPLKPDQAQQLHRQLAEWEIGPAGHLSKTFKFPNFVMALAFVNRIGDLAEQQNHHPLLHLTWGKVTVELWTHAVGGLSENDFIFAAKIDTLPAE